MTMLRAGLAALLTPVVLLLVAPPASAHPLGNLSVNTYDGVIVDVDGVRVDHVEDIAEVPAVAALRAADTSGDGSASPVELSTWAGNHCAVASARIRVSADGTPLTLLTNAASAWTAVGQAGLSTVRVECDLRADLQLARPTTLTVDIAPPSDLGWREITMAGDGTTIERADVPAASVSGRLTTYPGDLTTSPDERTATASVRPGGPRLASSAADGTDGMVTRGVDAVTAGVEGLVTQTGPLALLLLMLGGLVLGALHAFAPGHGKTVVAMAALASQGARRRELGRAAVVLGASITVAHTGSVVIVGVALTALGAVVPAALFPALAIVAGVIVVAVGVSLLRGRTGGHVHGPGGHTHTHEDEVPGHEHEHEHEHGHGHAPHASPGVPHGSAGAALHATATHSGEHPNPHHRDGRLHVSPAHDAGTRRRTLVALGAVGGLTPSPTALVVLLGTLAVGRPVAGLLAVLAFGVGMALTLVSAGLFATVLGQRIARVATERGLAQRWLASVPRFAGWAVVGAGLFLAVRGVLDLTG